MEEWRLINEFEGYAVSNQGDVANTKTDRILKPSMNQQSIPFVGLMRDGVQRQKAVCRLVAETFLEPAQFESFNSVINLDSDRCNNWETNLMWRPRWFSLQYHNQFRHRIVTPSVSIADMETGEEFINMWEAATKYGLLVNDIYMAVENQTKVWPTRQLFRRL